MKCYHISYSWLLIQSKQNSATCLTTTSPTSNLLDLHLLCPTLVPLPNDTLYNLEKAITSHVSTTQCYFIPDIKSPYTTIINDSFSRKFSHTLLIWDSLASHLHLPCYFAHAADTAFVLFLILFLMEEVLSHQLKGDLKSREFVIT